jgi:hypothetical protein
MTTRAQSRFGRLASLTLGAALLLALLPGSAAGARSFTFEVGKRADFVPQTNFVQCVGASMQMMLNMIEPGRDRTARTQLKLQRLARKWSGQRPDGVVRKGASVRGWTIGLNILDAGPYRLVGTKTLKGALLTAAKAIRQTGKPVGLLVWRGRHAWVMSGFRATGDPLYDPDVRITHAMVFDPLYPHGNAIWGRSPRPGEALTPSQLGRQFVKRQNRNRWSGVQSIGMDRKYVLVLPYLPEHPADGARHF